MEGTGVEFARYCRDTHLGMWEEVWRRADEKVLTERGDG